MGRPAARAGKESVFSPDGTGYKCKMPMNTKTGPPQGAAGKVYVQGTVVVVSGDTVAPHPKGGCTVDTSTASGSGKVFANGKGISRLGDSYGNNKILSGSSRVICG